MKYFYEVMTQYAPACGFLRSPYGRDTWEKAMAEAVQYATNAHVAGQLVAIRVVCIPPD